MHRLQARFGKVALFFFDRYDGRVIGVKWLLNAPVKSLATNVDILHSVRINRQPAGAIGAELDCAAALADMACLGSGLVADVRVLVRP